MGSELRQQIQDLEPGSHLCLFYHRHPTEQMPALVPFIQQGLAQNEQCIYVADDQTVDEVANALQSHGVAVSDHVAREALRLWTRRDWRQPGVLDSRKKLAQVQGLIEAAQAAGFDGIRFAIEMTWTLGPNIMSPRLQHWEATLNRLAEFRFPTRMICQYNRARLSLRTLQAALRTHPQVILGSRIYPSIFYQAPLLTGEQSETGEPDWMLAQLEKAYTAETAREALIRERVARAESERARRMIQETLDRITDGFVALDDDLRVTWLNQPAVHILQPLSSLPDGTSEQDDSTFPGLLDSALRTDCQHALAQQTPLVREKFYPSICAWFEVRIYPSADGLSLFLHDITERKQSESALRASEERFRALADAAPSMVWTADPDGTITFASERWFRYVGLTPEVNARQWPQLVLHPDDYERCVAEWTRALREGTEYEIEVRNRRYDGEYRWFLTRAVPAHDADGRITGWFGMTTDIHARKEAEAERDQLLARERAARAEAEAALRTRDQFLAIAAHELKTPLTSMLGYAELLRSEAEESERLNERERRAIQIIAEKTERLNQMITALFDVSRLENPDLRLADARVDLNALTHHILGQKQVLLKRHTIEFYGADVPLRVRGDQMRLEQVLQNLIQNAAKYSPNGGTIRVELERQGQNACLTVQDQGIGIPAQDLPRIFKRFYRASNAARNQITGLGIGLYVVSEIVHLHGGTIHVTSEEGKGSTFTVRLPLADSL